MAADAIPLMLFRLVLLRRCVYILANDVPQKIEL
jgi:hypothetical protein